MIRRRAHAKVNLALSVGPPEPHGPRAGFHPIASWMHAIDLFDEVEIAEAAGESRGRLSRRPARESVYEVDWAQDAPRVTEIDWPLERDLAVRAHRLLESFVGETLPLRLHIRKRIPVGGGLGGGSSNAAAVLLGVNELFGLGLSMQQLALLSLELGSDVAYFLDEAESPRPALVRGFGERIERTPSTSGEVLLLFPSFGCPTAEVYRAFDSLPQPGLREDLVRHAAEVASLSDERLFNDLTHAAERVRPELATLRGSLASSIGGPVHMSGSGSTLFALGTSPSDIDRVRHSHPGVAFVRARLL